MQINHFCTYPHGGAATAALRLHRSLLRQQVASTFYYTLNQRAAPQTPQVTSLQFIETPRIPLISAWNERWRRMRMREIHRQYREHLEQRPAHLETFSMAELPVPTRLPPIFVGESLAHLHWIAFMADYPSFFGSLPFHVPLVWTLHDMNPITGGCHFSGGCDRFVYGCGNCPQVVNPMPNDVSRHGLAAKKRSLKQRQIHVVTPSRWLNRLAQQSPVWPEDTTFSIIRYGVDLTTFHPTNRRQARQQIGIDPDAVVLGFVADQLQNPRKGSALLLQALSRLKQPERLQLLTLGSGQLDEIATAHGLPMSVAHRAVHLGYVDDPVRQALIYSACDFVAVPSLEDNLPQVAIEAIACGTPVVGFEVGGLTEIIQHGVHGMLATTGDVESLAHHIDWMIGNREERQVMGERARLFAMRELGETQQADKYAALYRQELSEARQRRAGAA